MSEDQRKPLRTVKITERVYRVSFQDLCASLAIPYVPGCVITKAEITPGGTLVEFIVKEQS